MRIPLLILSCLTLVACDTDLDSAYEDYRAQAPAVCKDYCEERVACERPTSTGIDDNDAFTTKVHQCIISCSSYASEGAWIWRYNPDETYERDYSGYVDSSSLMAGFECMYNIGAYRCVETSLGSGDYNHLLNPPVPTVCSEAQACILPFGINYNLYWQSDPSGIGGTCEKSGSDFIDAVFFTM